MEVRNRGLVALDLDVSVFGCLATRPDGFHNHVEMSRRVRTMPVSFVYQDPDPDWGT